MLIDGPERTVAAVQKRIDRKCRPLKMVEVGCCLCGDGRLNQIATGEDFEYRTIEDEFYDVRCAECGLVILNPRPDVSEFERIYPSEYHAFEFSEKEFGFVYKVRRRLEARRLLSWCRDLGDDARILDVGCGDGFHLGLLREFGNPAWKLEGIDLDARAVKIGRDNGLDIEHGTIGSAGLSNDHYDLVILIQTVEHVADPTLLLLEIRALLRPGGRLVIVTDNTDSLDHRIFKKRHWGGYHFPRHWNLFNKSNIRKLALNTGFEVEKLQTQVSPVNWTYSIRNHLVDRNAPKWIFECFSLRSTVALGFFTVFDTFFQFFGNGALLNAFFRKPRV